MDLRRLKWWRLEQRAKPPMRRIQALWGSLAALAGIAVVVAILVPFRAHLAEATCALVLVVPVVIGVGIGGFQAGLVAVAGGFLAYDYFFIPPYGTLSVGSRQNYLALAVYLAVMVAVARIVARLQAVRAEAAQRADSARRLFELSDVLITERPLDQLSHVIASTLQGAFGFDGVALLLAHGQGAGLRVGAAVGEAIDATALSLLGSTLGTPASLVRVSPPVRLGGRLPGRQRVTVPLVAMGEAVGALVVVGRALRADERQLLSTYANQAALALERARLRAQVIESEVLAEAERWQRALMGAVSHDLRTPLATITAAVSDLRELGASLLARDRDELLGLIESQSDRLARLVTSLLDMTRIQSGALAARPEPAVLAELVEEAVQALVRTEVPGRLVVELEEPEALVLADHALVVQVLTNLLDNAALHAPEAGAIEVSSRQVGGRVEISVADRGPGVAPADRERVFSMYSKTSGAGRAGLGLAIVKAFVEAHGERVRLEDRSGGGARFVFSLKLAEPSALDEPGEARGVVSPRRAG
ncbi:MAG: ATP-binding protein [Actinomycetota bacterium]|nr:ATP-binding protein [Actinomycetota bacterium]